ncbi:A/G-specific adenine glycosylase [Nitrospina watsonii]|uniref:Adenine DNA glycosylase n=1 Tax=Nitrospina watsonii TaxID=1323948 RepID=A0ABN8W4X9_9BACT|nr:A/G-specific adenine glycosylase [Nitrospina watsonii]CAI2719158.1 Adenine DNA glycosylase [Nitrospina watsonii]
MKPTPKSKTIARALLAWFDAERRPMPWRETRDPYRIWVSEIMLQQTQVKTVIPYYQRWIASFPTVEKLARARENTVLKHWEGLGYYSRARNLHRAAKEVVREHDGRVPDTLDGILSLPGIGRYTAGAVLSIAYNQPVPVLDGNVKRVVSRLFGLMENGATRKSETRLWEHAGSLLPATRPGDFNQSLMELGATVCLPQNPMCLLCPIAKHCEAFKQGEPERYPPPKQQPETKKIEVSAAIIQKEGKVFIQQRPRDGLMGGLWEFPGGKREKKENPEDCLIREIQEELGVTVAIREKLMTLKHAYTRFRVTLHAFTCDIESGRLRPTHCERWRWVRHRDLDKYTFPAANVKIVKHLKENGSS